MIVIKPLKKSVSKRLSRIHTTQLCGWYAIRTDYGLTIYSMANHQAGVISILLFFFSAVRWIGRGRQLSTDGDDLAHSVAIYSYITIDTIASFRSYRSFKVQPNGSGPWGKINTKSIQMKVHGWIWLDNDVGYGRIFCSSLRSVRAMVSRTIFLRRTEFCHLGHYDYVVIVITVLCVCVRACIYAVNSSHSSTHKLANHKQ